MRLPAVLLLLVVVLVSLGYARAQPAPAIGKPGTLAQEIALTRKAGLPAEPGDLKAAPVAADRNASQVYRELQALLKAKPLSQDDAVALEDQALKPSPTAGDLAAARVAVARRQDVVGLIRRAAAKPECRFDRNWSKGATLQLPEFAMLRRTARILAAQAVVQAADGHAADAARTCKLVLAMAHHASSDPIMIAHMVDWAIAAAGFRPLEGILRAGPDRATAELVQQAAASYVPRPPAEALPGEIAMAMATVDMLRREGTNALERIEAANTGRPTRSAGAPAHFPTDVYDRGTAYALWYYRSMNMALRLPLLEGRRWLDALTADLDARCTRHDPQVLVAVIILPVFSNIGSSHLLTVAHRDALRAAAAVVAWRAAHGSLPPTLRACMPQAPADPFSGKPLRYRVEGKGFVVYSVGPTGHYAGAARVPGKSFREAMVRIP